MIMVLIICNALPFALADKMSTAFSKREQYKNKTRLGNPNDAAKFIDRSANSSSLEQLDDASLVDQGRDALRSSELGKFLQDAEERKIEAISRYKINAQNAMLKNSLAIEENPMSKTGGKGLSASETSTSIEVKKSCTEGVDFNVDVGLELVLEAEEEEYLGPAQQKSINIPYPAVPQHWWIQGILTDSTYGGSSGHGYSGTSNIINQAYNEEIAEYIALKVAIDSEAEIEVPKQNINFIPYADRSRNVNFSGCPSTFGIYTDYNNAIVTFTYSIQEKLKKFVEKAEYWQVATEGTEKLAEANECYETSRSCIKSGAKTFFGKYEVTRPCWYEKISYRCTSEPKNGCDYLIKQDCRLENSTCEYRVGSICLRWKRDYVCGGVKKERHYSLADSPIYCLGGDCHTPTIEENHDFANVDYLAALNEAKKDCVKSETKGICKDPITVFPGKSNGCEKIIVGLIDCCSSMKGWGKNVHLCKCSGEEKGLALKRDKGLCHRVGTYCKKRDPVFKQCLVKKTNFCCFSSKLARIFHEQGRKQLGIGWGSSSSPNCRPLTLDELKSLDFSKFDLEELFDALLNKGKKNMHKSFPTLTPGEIPAIQKEHMKTNPEEKREIRRKSKAEQERLEKERLAKLEAERLEKERLAKLEAERQAKLEEERREKLNREKWRARLDNSRRMMKKLLNEKKENHRKMNKLVYVSEEYNRLAARNNVIMVEYYGWLNISRQHYIPSKKY